MKIISHPEARLDAIVFAAREQGRKVEVKDFGPNRYVTIITELAQANDVWEFHLDVNGRVLVHEGYYGLLQSGPRRGKEVARRHKSNLLQAEHRFEVPGI